MEETDQTNKSEETEPPEEEEEEVTEPSKQEEVKEIKEEAIVEDKQHSTEDNSTTDVEMADEEDEVLGLLTSYSERVAGLCN